MEDSKTMKLTVVRSPKKTPAEKQQFSYKKLVVPVTMRSIYWKFFGFPANESGEIITKSKIVCILCKTQIAYNRNTTNLRMHLQNKHSEELSKIEMVSSLSVVMKDKKPKKSSGGRSRPIREIQTKCVEEMDLQSELRVEDRVAYVVSNDEVSCLFNEDFEKLCESITRHVTNDLTSPDVVQSTGFLKLIVSLVSPCRIPSLAQLTDDFIPRSYFKVKEQLTFEISKINGHVSLTVEEWTSANHMSYLTILLYYYNDENNLQHRLLSTLPIVANLPSSGWIILFTNVLEEYNLKKNKVSAVVYATFQEEIITALKELEFTAIPCIDFTIQHCVGSCFDNEDIKEIITKIRGMLSFINTNKEALTTLREQEIVNEIESNAFRIDNDNVWMTTYTMLENACARRYILQDILENNMNEIERECVELTESQWDMLNDVKNVLDPFKVAIETLSDDKVPLISILKPVLWQLTTTKLQIEEEEDSVTTSSLKNGLSDLLNYKYNDDETSFFLDMTAMLDPRFKLLPYVTDKTKGVIGESIKKKLVEELKDCADDKEKISKEIRLSGISLLLGNVNKNKKQVSTPEERAEREYSQYLTDVGASLETCPVEWWDKFSFKYPTLNKLANKYLCVPSFAILPGKVAEDVRLSYHLKRSIISPELVDKILFLHVNSSESNL